MEALEAVEVDIHGVRAPHVPSVLKVQSCNLDLGRVRSNNMWDKSLGPSIRIEFRDHATGDGDSHSSTLSLRPTSDEDILIRCPCP